MKAKQLFQQTERKHPGLRWSEKLSQKETEDWKAYIAEADILKDLRVDRNTAPTGSTVHHRTLVAFSDASAVAIGAVLYEVCQTSQGTFVTLLRAGNKVVPLKKQEKNLCVKSVHKTLMINRHELTGMLFAA
jgi:hypothetical protein